MSEFQLEDGIPTPSASPGIGRRRYPFYEMEVGQSFVVEGDTKDYNRLRAAAGRVTMRLGKRFTVRQVGPGQWRCWRIE